MQENLVIVESPAKAKTIEKFLGKDYVVKSSFGHIRDLAKKDLGIDLDSGFSPIYEIPDDKKKVVAELSKLAHSVKTVWLASDEDREGEAIAWHLTEVLGLPVETTKRIVFHEITKKAILSAIEEPRTVNMDLVNAQQARRVLDRLVGFELSPVLWKKVKPSLSAGRVQSVAVRLLVEREREIIDFKPTDYFRVVAQFIPEGDEKSMFRAELSRRFEKREEAVAFLESCKGARFSVVKCEEKPSQRVPAPPFTTSTLQQEAGRKLGMSVSQTMSLAQRLYEQGLITYMRTDSVNLSGQALAQTKEEVIKLFGEKYHQIRNYKTKTKGAQEAHEAIRPSYLDRTTIEGNSAEKRLYELIWKRTVASQMVAAEIDRTIITIDMNGGEAQFVATGEVVRFDGFLKLYSESTDDDQSTDATQGLLPALAVGQSLEAQSIVATQRFTQAPTRYNEALLVKRLEELGIGRPSTYAPTITTIINRGYVVKQNKEGVKRAYEQLTLDGKNIKSKMLSENIGKEKSRLAPTDIGMMVNRYLEKSFPTIMDYNFTASVEKQFDEIAEGEMEWTNMIGEFYSAFHPTVEQALETQSEVANYERTLGIDPVSGKEVSARIGRYGPMVQIGGNDGEKARFASLKAGQLIASITLEEALELFSLPRDLGELDGDRLVVGLGKFGPYLRNNNKFTSLPKGEDPYTIGYERAVELVKAHQKELATANLPVKTFAEDADMLIKNGRYGVYIAYKGKNYRIPKGRKVEELTYADCLKIVESSKK
ncbi:MAG: type I DNA topoisomerase [Rikenellaceae bacterium]|jgi:DNA topoisomerase-1|nr:type I DNA topoisomerase [Rikenellaceae bacterium]MBQ2019675.1 type I DNA topoisomerase [Rikenellaceae bacterium]MBQ5371324.1 type I DNA topoisomerase [Rikenellaceae bacterium]